MLSLRCCCVCSISEVCVYKGVVFWWVFLGEAL